VGLRFTCQDSFPLYEKGKRILTSEP
jgi:hypothetical protein